VADGKEQEHRTRDKKSNAAGGASGSSADKDSSEPRCAVFWRRCGTLPAGFIQAAARPAPKVAQTAKGSIYGCIPTGALAAAWHPKDLRHRNGSSLWRVISRRVLSRQNRQHFSCLPSAVNHSCVNGLSWDAWVHTFLTQSQTALSAQEKFGTLGTSILGVSRARAGGDHMSSRACV
jgi:hypothetical protein